MHTVPLHASKQQLRGIFSQGHMSRSRSLQKSRKNGVSFKIFIYQPIHENKMHTVPLHASKQQLRGISPKVIGKVTSKIAKKRCTV